MSYKHVYTVYSGDDVHWHVTKMERDWEPIETYKVPKALLPDGRFITCSCFAGNKETCRHRELVRIFQDAQATDSRRAYDYDKKRWFESPKAAFDV